MSLQECNNLSDAEPLFLRLNLYLKPVAKLLVAVELPHFKKLIGKSVSTLEIIDKIKELVKPHEFLHVKVVTSTVSIVELEVEAENKARLNDILRRLDNKVLKLKNFKDVCKVRASIWKQEYPSQQEWNTFFTNSKEMDETKPGERPDTIHISALPIRWFTHTTDDKLPSERLLFELFLQFGKIRKVDIPMCDPYRSKMKKYLTGMNTYSSTENEFFEAYIQFYDYSGFMKAMEAFRGMKLLHKHAKTAHTVEIKVDYDKTKHLSCGFIKRREILRDRLRQKESELKNDQKRDTVEGMSREKETDVKASKEDRKKQREERRKVRLLDKLKEKSSDAMDEKIAKEERKILKAKRRLEAIRLIEALFRRISKKIDLKDKSIEDIIKEKKQLMQTTTFNWSDYETSSSSSSSEHDGRESSDATSAGPSHSKQGWCHPFFGGTYLHPNQTYPLLQQEEYVKYFSKFLYNKDNRFRNNPRYRPRPPPHRYPRNYNSHKPYRRRVRSRSSSESSSTSSSRSRRRSSTKSTHKSRRS